MASERRLVAASMPGATSAQVMSEVARRWNAHKDAATGGLVPSHVLASAQKKAASGLLSAGFTGLDEGEEVVTWIRPAHPPSFAPAVGQRPPRGACDVEVVEVEDEEGDEDVEASRPERSSVPPPRHSASSAGVLCVGAEGPPRGSGGGSGTAAAPAEPQHQDEEEEEDEGIISGLARRLSGMLGF